jgi:hypothetical protein
MMALWVHKKYRCLEESETAHGDESEPLADCVETWNNSISMLITVVACFSVRLA